jgi:hypothetical protein
MSNPTPVNAVLRLTRRKAIELHNTINIMAGPVPYQLLRRQVLQAIIKVWREIKELPKPPVEGVPPAVIDEAEVRKVLITGRQQRAVGEGLYELTNIKEHGKVQPLTDAQFASVMDMAEVVGVAGWLETKILENVKPENELPDDVLGNAAEPDLVNAVAPDPDPAAVPDGGGASA